MARGWESKAVESQQEEAARRSRPARRELTADERARAGERRSLELARTRMRQELSVATHPEHRQLIEQTIEALDGRIADLTRGEGDGQ